MKKPIKIGISIIIGILIVITIIGYLGSYPSFFPDFIKYNKFFPQVVTREVFRIENFSDPEKDFSGFLKEVEDTVHKLWREDAKLAYIRTFFIPEANKEVFAYELIFRKQHIESQKEWPLQLNDLNVFYNADLIVEKKSFANQSLQFRFHINEIVNNKILVARECVNKFLCGQLPSINVEEIELSNIKISAKQAFELALVKYPDMKERGKEYASLWLGFIQSTDNISNWIILHSPPIIINAQSGEILE